MRCKVITAIASLLLASLATTPAAAMQPMGLWSKTETGPTSQPPSRPSYVGAGGEARSYQPRRSRQKRSYQARSYRKVYATPPRNVSGIGPRPRKWCGWWMRTQKGGGPEFNVAWNWRKYGSPLSGPQVGAVVVWRHHVGMITGRSADGRWIVKSGNDSNRVRERARSVKGAIFRM